MMFAIIILMIGVMAFFPETALGTYLRKVLVERLAEKLNASILSRLVLITSIILLAALLIFYSKGQVDPLLAQVGVEATPWFVSFDLLTFVDVIAAVLLLRLAVRFTVIVYKLRQAANRVRRYTKQVVSVVHRNRASRRRLRSRAKKVRGSGTLDVRNGFWACAVRAGAV